MIREWYRKTEAIAETNPPPTEQESIAEPLYILTTRHPLSHSTFSLSVQK